MSPPPLKRAAAQRHPFSVASACHHRPGDADEHRAPAQAPGDDGASLDDAFRRHGAALLRFLGRRAGDEAAPDLMQDVFARAAGSPQRHRLVNPGGFLRRIAQNLLIDRARRHRRDNVLLFSLREEHDAACPAEQEHGLEAADLLRLYEQAVEAMPPKTRRVFLMHRVDELSYREIHERVGISVATVEYHMMKALAHIDRALEGCR
ncbi:RNA polymerase sigma factor [Sphingopyxis sp.]|uniref:RNA polymerase sigma factor n=1 Tax=Sphingopyxis sp. TaxID=1908224 RepID=UPI002D790346|nr:sigma-70 family RNA polymerase sigma factor [Sphingopyxis sp.]HET6523520.1 sigma-70 family RNA polymerase sigma factor [Sphingopyxis sp.]